jgi:hypothetical protein
MARLVVQTILGFRPNPRGIDIQPMLPPGQTPLSTRFFYRGVSVEYSVSPGDHDALHIDGAAQSPDSNGAFRIDHPTKNTRIDVTVRALG